MEEQEKNNGDTWIERTPTVGDSIDFQCRGFEREEAQLLANSIYAYLRDISRVIDLTTLDGITIATDYDDAIAQLDRGYTATPDSTGRTNNEHGEGVAVTPVVVRDGKIKSHIILSGGVAVTLLDPEHEMFSDCMYVLAHECAHVEITATWDALFPDTLLKPINGFHPAVRANIARVCFEEYAATWISSGIGADQTSNHVTLLTSHLKADPYGRAVQAFRDFHRHQDHWEVTVQTYRVFAEIMKHASYLMGTMKAKGITFSDLPEVSTALDRSGCRDFIERLGEVCSKICDQFGAWESAAVLDSIADIADEMVADSGLSAEPMEDGQMYVHVPYV